MHEQDGSPADRIPDLHAEQRTLPMTLGFATLVVFFVAATSFPAAASLFRVTRTSALVVGGMWLAANAAATAAFRLTGMSRLYLLLEAVESFCLQAGFGWFIYRSGNALSIFWLAYMIHAQILASLGWRLYDMIFVAATPATLALAFDLKGDAASASLCLVVGGSGAYFYGLMARVHSRLQAALARESALKNTLARHRVAEERSRIARDLHDGVAGELSALMWRLRRAALDSEASGSETTEPEIAHLEGRLRGALDSLRQVVLDLRQEPRSWDDTMAALRERCRDLCGARELAFTVSGVLEAPLFDAMAGDVGHIVSELVRNAVTHAEPRRVEVRIRVGDGVEVSVADDGSGLPADYASRSTGGLVNLRQRVTRLGGELEIRAAHPGTHVAVRLPLVSHGHGMATPRGNT